MFGKTSFEIYPNYEVPLTHSCFQCLYPLCHSKRLTSIDMYPSERETVHQQLFTIPTWQNTQDQNECNIHYLKRNNCFEYSDLAMGFSKHLPINSKLSRDYGNCKQTVGPAIFGASKDFFSKNKNAEIWRPFTPPIEHSNYSLLQNKFFDENWTITKIPKRTHSFIIPSIEKLDHSNSSLFIPVKKRSQSCCQNNPQLSTNMRLHTGSKSYSCGFPTCSKSFARNEELTRHRRIHSGFKPHLCNTCGKSFGRKDHLSKHMKTHLEVSEKKVHVCCVSGCGHRYTRSDALTRHKSNAHAILKTKSTSGKAKKLKEEIKYEF